MVYIFVARLYSKHTPHDFAAAAAAKKLLFSN